MKVESPARRQARFSAEKVIVPADLDAGRWYDVCHGRRTTDQRPGMVLLDLGDRRVLMPEACLEFRAAAVESTSALRRAPARRAHPMHMVLRAGLRAARSTLVAHPVGAALSLLPVGLLAIAIAGRTSR